MLLSVISRFPGFFCSPSFPHPVPSGYGASALLNERLVVSSDQYAVHVCPDCGMMVSCIPPPVRLRAVRFLSYLSCCLFGSCFQAYEQWCQHCRKVGRMEVLSMPYACKLLLQELQAMCIRTRLQVER